MRESEWKNYLMVGLPSKGLVVYRKGRLLFLLKNRNTFVVNGFDEIQQTIKHINFEIQ